MGNCFSVSTTKPEKPSSHQKVYDVIFPPDSDSDSHNVYLPVTDFLPYINSISATKQSANIGIWMNYHSIISKLIHHPNSVPFLPFFSLSRLPLYYQNIESDCNTTQCNQTHHTPSKPSCPDEFLCVLCFIKKCFIMQKNAVETKKFTEMDLTAAFGQKTPSNECLRKAAVNLVLSCTRSRKEWNLNRLFCKAFFDLVFPQAEYYQGFRSFVKDEFPELSITFPNPNPNPNPNLSITLEPNPELFVIHLQDLLEKYLEGERVKENVNLPDNPCFQLLYAMAVYYNQCTKVVKVSNVFLGSPLEEIESGPCLLCSSSSSPVHLPLFRLHSSQNHSLCIFCCIYLAKLKARSCPFCDEEIDFKDSLRKRRMKLEKKLEKEQFCLDSQDFPSYLYLFSHFLPSLHDKFIPQFLASRSQVRRDSMKQFRIQLGSHNLDRTSTPFTITNHQRASAKDFLLGLEAARSCVSKYLSNEDTKRLKSFFAMFKEVKVFHFIERYSIKSDQMFSLLRFAFSISNLLPGQTIVLDDLEFSLHHFYRICENAGSPIDRDLNIGVLIFLLLRLLETDHTKDLCSEFHFYNNFIGHCKNLEAFKKTKKLDSFFDIKDNEFPTEEKLDDSRATLEKEFPDLKFDFMRTVCTKLRETWDKLLPKHETKLD
ncbi:hypothetical protein P9112_010073 [Eukaryota sp. TZLM1-RC]